MPNDFHSVLESLNRVRKIIEDLVLVVESLIHLQFELLPQPFEFIHRLPLEFFHVLVLSLKLILHVVSEGAELQALVCALIIYLLMKFVLLIVQLLQNVLFTVDTSLHLIVKSALLILQISAHDQNGLVTFDNAVLDLLMNAGFNSVHSFLRDLKLVSIVLTHFPDFLLKILLKESELVLKLGCKRLECVLHTLNLCVGEVFISLYFSSDILELGL